MTGRTTAEIVGDLREWVATGWTTKTELHREAADRLAELEAADQPASIADMAALWVAVHEGDDMLRRNVIVGLDDMLAFLRSVRAEVTT